MENNLWKLLANGDERTYEYLFDQYYLKLCHIAFMYVKDTFVAENLVGDLFFYLWKNRTTIQVNESISSYLFSAIRNRAINYQNQASVNREIHFSQYEELEDFSMFESKDSLPLEQIIEEKKQESPAPVMLDKNEMKNLLEKSGVKEEKLENFEEHFEMAAGEHGKLVASNVSSGKKFEVKTPDVVIKINSDKTDIVSTQVIDGRQCLVIQIDERLVVNGISVNPDTGEVIDRNVEEYIE